MNTILVISPHPDDESIGCGGTLRQHVLDGDTVQIIFLTSGEKGGHGRTEVQTAALRETEARNAADILGVQALDFWREPDGALVPTEALVHRLVDHLRHSVPVRVYVTHDNEMHPDHKAAAALVHKAVTAAVDLSPSPEVWMYEIWTPLQKFDQSIDISQHLEVKLAAIRAHTSQCEVMKFDESAKGLARYRGEMHSWPGGDYAEVFREWTPRSQQ